MVKAYRNASREPRRASAKRSRSKSVTPSPLHATASPRGFTDLARSNASASSRLLRRQRWWLAKQKTGEAIHGRAHLFRSVACSQLLKTEIDYALHYRIRTGSQAKTEADQHISIGDRHRCGPANDTALAEATCGTMEADAAQGADEDVGHRVELG